MRRILPVLVAAALALPWAVVRASDDAYFDKQWGLKIVGAPQAWGVGTGAGVKIAVVDTGVDLDHPDLRANLELPGRNLADSGPPEDDHGHGTHVAGIAAAVADNGLGVAGVARGARIMPVRVLRKDPGCQGDACGATGSSSDVDNGIRWAADNGAHVVNLSLGEDLPLLNLATLDLASALNYAWNKGAIPVIAAGNSSGLSLGSVNVNAIVVAATTRSDSQPGYSNGVGDAKWGMSAPGGSARPPADDNVWSTYKDNRYASLAGTSMAVPHVAGAAAVLRAKGLSKEQTVQRLLDTAKPLGTYAIYGAGRLDLARAVEGLAGGGQPGSTGAGGSGQSEPGSAPAPARRSRTTTAAPPGRPKALSGGGPTAPPLAGAATPAPPPAPETDAPAEEAGGFAAPRRARSGVGAGPLAAGAGALAGLGVAVWGWRRFGGRG